MPTRRRKSQPQNRTLVHEAGRTSTRQIRDGLVRAVAPTSALRAASDDEGVILSGLWSVFGTWTEIWDPWEGRFMERIQRGAFERTLRENTPKILLQHGRDPVVGLNPIGTVLEAKEDARGGFGKARLFDGLPEYIIEGLRSSQFGASFRFTVVREEVEARPEASSFNPDRLPQRTITEAKVTEFGPCTWGAYPDAQLVVARTAEFGDARHRPSHGHAGLSPDARRAVLAGAMTAPRRPGGWLGGSPAPTRRRRRKLSAGARREAIADAGVLAAGLDMRLGPKPLDLAERRRHARQKSEVEVERLGADPFGGLGAVAGGIGAGLPS